jgi:hypothetical protein
MLAWEVARQFQQDNSPTQFEHLLGAYLSAGLVHSTPSVFVLAREVTWDPNRKEILNFCSFAATSNHNAWFVEIAASNDNNRGPRADGVHPIWHFLRCAPYPQEFVLWRRQFGNRHRGVHAHTWKNLSRRVGLQSI